MKIRSTMHGIYCTEVGLMASLLQVWPPLRPPSEFYIQSVAYNGKCDAIATRGIASHNCLDHPRGVARNLLRG